MASSAINRITLFKITSPEDQQKLLDIYTHMPSQAVKVRILRLDSR
jgi:hypothetical protein